MSWRKHETHKAETKAVKAALKAAGISAKVGHGKGTAWAWLHIHINENGCLGEHTCDGRFRRSDCPRCQKTKKLHDDALRVAQEVTGRHGEYGGEINVFWPL